MKIEQAENARMILDCLEVVNKIKAYMEGEINHWWSFLTPDIKNWDKDGIKMPEILCKEFAKAVDRSIEQLEKQIKEL